MAVPKAEELVATPYRHGGKEQAETFFMDGMTRAMQRLYLTHAEVRRLYGQENYTRPSRFIDEIPAEFLEEVRASGAAQPLYRPQRLEEEGDETLRVGQAVQHAKFGTGVVLAAEGSGAQARVQVNFDGIGSKWLVLAYANLELI